MGNPDQTMLVLPVATRAGVEWVDRQFVIYKSPSIIKTDTSKYLAEKSALLKVGSDHKISPQINEAESLSIE